MSKIDYGNRLSFLEIVPDNQMQYVMGIHNVEQELPSHMFI
jgi:hypothetical protein